MKKHLLVWGLTVLCFSYAQSQSTNAPLNRDYYHLIDRYEIKSSELSGTFHSSVKPYTRRAIANFADSVRTMDIRLSGRDRFNLEYLSNDNWEWSTSDTYLSRRSFLGMYKAKSDLFHVDTEEFDLHVNPVLYLSMGAENEVEGRPFINTRGAEIRGMINRKVGFYTFVGENQALFPEYVNDRIFGQYRAVPGEGFWKKYGDGRAVDFFTARGYISVNATKAINVQFGHDRFNIGNGYRSMILSDFAHNYLFMKLNTKVWKLNYTNIFAEMYGDAYGSVGGSLASRFPKKYMAFHHLSLNIGKSFNIGLFESIMFGSDPATGSSGFEFTYLNPIIFYRAIEQQGGSQDNAILGADFKWNLLNRFSLYGQWVLDEFKMDHIRAKDGWWANKYAGQLGLKYIDVLGLQNLDIQLEYNFARPFTYSHDSPYSNYAHYLQPLAHPLGANFTEKIFLVRYQPLNRLHLTGKVINANFGEDPAGQTMGGDILKSYRTRTKDFGNEIGQGINTTTMFYNFTASYMLRHNLFIDLKQIYRTKDQEDFITTEKTIFTSIALRLNIQRREQEF
ncbi:MAG: hypothetical protein M3421_07405 [Bacteroidota bacterium]|nr:hypothetical protein [Bacteroidota bacterium]